MFDNVGWGFNSHGGFPSNPWHSWQMNRSTTAYFVGNASGMDSPAELALETQVVCAPVHVLHRSLTHSNLARSSGTSGSGCGPD